MLTRMIFLSTILSSLVGCNGCNTSRDAIVEEKKEKVNAAIKIGDDIFEARDKLIEEGFKIQYGPDFPTKTRKYYMMIVDYGLVPNELDNFKYMAGIENDKLMTGVIKADSDGKITSIK